MAIILMDQWTGSRVLRQAVELSSGIHWVEWDPLAVCSFYNLPGSIVLIYLLMSKQITYVYATVFSSIFLCNL